MKKTSEEDMARSSFDLLVEVKALNTFCFKMMKKKISESPLSLQR